MHGVRRELRAVRRVRARKRRALEKRASASGEFGRGRFAEAPDELVSQLVTSLDLDHDGALCLSEFVAGFKEGNRQGLQLRSPQTGVSSRRHFRRVPWNHPIHNAAEAIMPSNTLAFLGGS